MEAGDLQASRETVGCLQHELEHLQGGKVTFHPFRPVRIGRYCTFTINIGIYYIYILIGVCGTPCRLVSEV